MIHRTLRPNEIGGSKILEDLREREKKTEKNDSQFSTASHFLRQLHFFALI